MLPNLLKGFTSSSSTPKSSAMKFSSSAEASNYAATVSSSSQRSLVGVSESYPSEEILKFWFEKFVIFLASVNDGKISIQSPPNPISYFNTVKEGAPSTVNVNSNNE